MAGHYGNSAVYGTDGNLATKLSQCGSSGYNSSRMAATEAIEQESALVPKNSLTVYPNPFTGNTVFELDIEQDNSLVMLTITDLMGKKIDFNFTEVLQKGKQMVDFDGTKLGLTAGTYIVAGSINGKQVHLKLIKE